MYLPDSRLLAPELLEPGRKPASAVEIDWSSPLAKGLTVVCLFKNKKNLVNNVEFEAILNNAVFVDLSLQVDGVDDAIVVTTETTHNGATTILAKARWNVMGAGLYQIFTADTNGSGKREWQFRVSSNALQFIPFVSNSNGSVTGTIPLSANNTYTLGAVHDNLATSNNMRVFVNGVLDNTGTFTGNLDQDEANKTIGARTTFTSDYQNSNILEESNATFEYVYQWSRALTDEELKVISEDPYQFLVPK